MMNRGGDSKLEVEGTEYFCLLIILFGAYSTRAFCGDQCMSWAQRPPVVKVGRAPPLMNDVLGLIFMVCSYWKLS